MALFFHDGETPPTAPSKDPNSEEPYGNDYATSVWAIAGKTIDDSQWLIDDTLITSDGQSVNGLTVDRPTAKPSTPATSFDDTSTTVWLHGGTIGTTYFVTNRLTLSDGRVIDVSFWLEVKAL